MLVNKYCMVGCENYVEMSDSSGRARFSDSFSSYFNIINSNTQKLWWEAINTSKNEVCLSSVFNSEDLESNMTLLLESGMAQKANGSSWP